MPINASDSFFLFLRVARVLPNCTRGVRRVRPPQLKATPQLGPNFSLVWDPLDSLCGSLPAVTSKEGSRRANYPILTQGGSDKKYQYEASCLVIGMRTI